MKATSLEKIEYWRNHYEQSIIYPNGVQAYCENNKLATSAYYKWRKRILNLKPSKNITKKSISPFLPAVVTSEASKMLSYPHQKITYPLPDSKWVAEVISNVIRGLL
jgi:hypothetical protein